MNIYDLEQFILFLLVKYSELDLRDLKLKIERLEPTLSDRLLNYQLSLLKEEGYIEFVEDQSSEYRKCLEAHKTDKRIKSVARYCRERYPTSIKVKILDAGKIRYAHGCFCLNYCLTKNTETAMLNMNLCEKLADIKTRPPSKCLC